jgi:hypothetical protein
MVAWLQVDFPAVLPRGCFAKSVNSARVGGFIHFLPVKDIIFSNFFDF